MKLKFTLFVIAVFLISCKKSNITDDVVTTKIPTTPQTYLALGDSYTIGQAVLPIESFPFQLQLQLQLKGISIANGPQIIARTGWTTSDLIAAIKTAVKEKDVSEKFDIVTLLIGVNNQYQNQSQIVYRKEFRELLQTAINFADGNKNKVFVISIPDWGATPFGGTNNLRVRKEIDEFNAINKTETLALRISYTDITEASRNAATDLTLVAKDELHPSGKMYLDWAIQVTKAIMASFNK